MSEFVLKLAGWESDTPIVWLPGVTKVQRMGIAAWRDVLPMQAEGAECKVSGKWDNYNPDMQFVSNNIGPDYVVTLLWIETGSYRGYAVVEQAWLVGPGGGTVDRLSGV